MNYRFDMNEWLPRFPLKPEHGRFRGLIITGPFDLCYNEQLRQRAADQFDWGPAVPVDVFVMAEGEPANRHVTKIGGLPYRPADLDWPINDDGAPLTFLAQFDFTDSAEIVEDLPGQVLLIFTADEGDEGDVESLHFEWHPLGMTDLVARNEVPDQKWRIDPCYGYRHRTVSYPNARRTEKNKNAKYPICNGMEIWSSHHLLQYQATQIGQSPFFIQDGDRDLPGRMLCTVSSVMPDSHDPYPWVNHPKPLAPENEWPPDDNYFKLGDAGCIYISIDDAGDLHTNASCY